MSFLHSLPSDGPARDAYILDAIRAGRLDQPTWCRVQIGDTELEVASDYLKIDGERVPMTPAVAQAAVDSLDALLPTPAVVDAIEEAARAAGELVPFDPWPRYQDDSQLARETILWREANIARRINAAKPALIAGCLKDVVLAANMPAGKVVIYGARYADGGRVQPLYTGHGDWFSGGYAHGARAVRRRCWVNGGEVLLDELYQRAPLGPVARLRYPLAGSTNAPHGDSAPPQVQSGGSHVAVSSARPTPTVPTVLRRGHTGPAVIELQSLLSSAGYPTKIDGDFGPDTERQVKAFQAAHPPLAVDGLAGPRTMTALRGLGDTDRPPPVPIDLDALPFVQARNYHQGRLRPLRCIVLHTAEIAEVADAAERLAAWAAGPSAPMASWHFGVDADAIVRCVRDEDTAFAAPGLNADGIQIEMSGRAGQGADGWADTYSKAVLARAAGLVAALCRRHGLPVAFVDAAGLLRGELGISTHAEVTKAYQRSTHTDPGKDFPMAAFLRLVVTHK